MVGSIHSREYARPELLAETAWLAEQVGNPAVRIIDARGANDYAGGHIDGAVHMDGFGKLPRSENGDMGSPEEFAKQVGALGIGNEHTVVVYDTPSQRMGMVTWSFLYYGHRDVRILDGGVAKWQTEGRALVTAPPAPVPATYISTPVESVYCTLDQARAGVGNPDFVFWDTRSADEFAGTAGGFRAASRPGRIPGAAHLEWSELFDPTSRTLKTGPELRELLAGRGITPDKQVASYCHGGARGALGAYVLRILGYDRGQAYAGSFQQWADQADTVVER